MHDNLNKKYYFLAGLPRAGNTLFASLMNQNPTIAVTGNSPVAELIHITTKLYNDEILRNFPDTRPLDNVIKHIMPNYFEGFKQKYIIDRQAWGHSILFDKLKTIIPNKIKVIVLVRPLEEILASFIKIAQTTESNYIKSHGKTVDEQCDYLMSEGGMIDLQLKGIKNLMRFENRGYAHFIEYDDLVNNTKKELDDVYDFLEIKEHFNHSLTNLSQLTINGVQYDDSFSGVKLHTIKTNSIKKSKYNVSDYLPDYLITKCQNMNFWRDRY